MFPQVTTTWKAFRHMEQDGAEAQREDNGNDLLLQEG